MRLRPNLSPEAGRDALLSRWPETRLEPCRPDPRFTELRGDPAAPYRSIHLTGTNGKTLHCG